MCNFVDAVLRKGLSCGIMIVCRAEDDLPCCFGEKKRKPDGEGLREMPTKFFNIFDSASKTLT